VGNWRTVHIDGTCDEAQVAALKKACAYGDDYENFHCLSYHATRPSLCGLFDWPKTRIHSTGNLAERDFGVDDVVEQLQKLVAVAPSLRIKVHCGADWEEKHCIATVTVAGGQVTRGDPEIETLPEMDTSQMMGRMFMTMARPRG
jgi:hypothetical protein